jgi:hypothetical protein
MQLAKTSLQTSNDFRIDFASSTGVVEQGLVDDMHRAPTRGKISYQHLERGDVNRRSVKESKNRHPPNLIPTIPTSMGITDVTR